MLKKDAKMPLKFQTQVTISFDQADPAGIMFFGEIYRCAHRAFEQFVLQAGFTWSEYFRTPDWLIPLRHSQADYLAPLLPGQTYQVTIYLTRLSQGTLQVQYDFTQGSKLHAQVQTVHTYLNARTKEKTAMPDQHRQRWEQYLISEDSSTV